MHELACVVAAENGRLVADSGAGGVVVVVVVVRNEALGTVYTYYVRTYWILDTTTTCYTHRRPQLCQPPGHGWARGFQRRVSGTHGAAWLSMAAV